MKLKRNNKLAFIAASLALLLAVKVEAIAQEEQTTGEVAATDEETCWMASDCSGAPYTVCTEGVCLHKHIHPFLTSEIIGIVTLPFLLGLANIGGIGGGGLIIPLAIGCWGFKTSEAVSLSNSTVFLGSLIRFFGFSIRQKHPNSSQERTIIDYNVASIMIPAVLLGSFSGLYLSALLPEAVTMILMTVLLLFMTYNTYKKMVKLCRKESRERENYTELQQQATASKTITPSSVVLQQNSALSPGNSDKRLLVSKADAVAANAPKVNKATGYQELKGSDDSGSKQIDQKLQRLIKREQTDFGMYRHHVIAFLVILVAFVVQLLRGSKKSPSLVGIDRCSAGDNIILTLFLMFTVFMIHYEIKRVKREQKLKIDNGVQLAQGELEISGNKLFTLLTGSIVGGIVGAMGLGGAVVFNPVLLTLGVPPEVVGATGMYLIMYSQLANTATYILMGTLPINYAIWIGFWSCLGILICLLTISNLINRSGRTSIVVLILTVLLLASALMIPIFSWPKLQALQARGVNVWSFTNPCV